MSFSISYKKLREKSVDDPLKYGCILGVLVLTFFYKKCIKIEKQVIKMSEIYFVFSEIFLYKQNQKVKFHL